MPHAGRLVGLMWAIALVAAIPVAVSFAQDAPSLAGVVSDPTGTAVASAQVELTRDGARAGSVIADASGRYRFTGLSRGRYVVRVTAPGFEPVERSVDIQTAAVTADVRLTVGGLREDVKVVAAAGYARRADELPVSATIVSREQALASPERSVDGLLRHVASVQLQQDDADAVHPLVPSMAMRGLGVGDTADRGLVLVDGLPLNSGFYGNVAWNRAPKEDIERVEVVRGASSSLFGSFAMGGVVDVITRRPSRRETSADLQYGQYNRVQANVHHADVLGPRAAFSVNGSLLDTDGYYRVAEEDRRPIDEPLAGRLGNVQGRFDAGLGKRTRGFVKAGYNDQHRSGGYQLQRADTGVVDLAGGVDVDLETRGTLEARAMFAHEDFDVRNVRIVDDDTTFVANPHVTESDDVGLSARWTRSVGRLLSNVTAGGDVRRVNGSDSQEVYNAPGVLSAGIVGGGIQTSFGLFAQASVRPSRTSEILAGLRVDRFSNTNGRIETNGSAVPHDDRTLTFVSPRVAGRFQVTPMIGVRGAVFGGFRAPTLAELYRSFESPTFRGLSNPDLGEERLKGGDGGLEIRHRRLTAQVNGFYNRLEDFVGSAEVGFVGGKFTVQAMNVAAVRSRGLEAMGTVAASTRVSIISSYTFTDATVVEGELTGNAVEGAPRHAFSVAAMYVEPRTTLTLKVRYVGDSFQDISNEAPQEAHTIVDLRASRRLHRHLEAFVAGENIFDDSYVADGFGGSLGAPRQFSAGFRVSF